MIKKTKEFNDKFMKDIEELSFNKHIPLRILGSYNIKTENDFITDIDVSTFVRYDEFLLTIIRKKLHNLIKFSKNFQFVQLVCGYKKEITVPWKIDNKGSCDFNIDNVKLWINEIQKTGLVGEHTMKIIKKTLLRDGLKLKDLVNIENMLNESSKLVWTLRDVMNGYHVSGQYKYTLLDVIKTETPVLEFIYFYKDSLTTIDLGLVDNNYKFPQNSFIPFYTRDWYKIMKYLRWIIKDEYRLKYNDIMKEIEYYIVLLYQMETLEKIENLGMENKKLQIYVKNEILQLGLGNLTYDRIKKIFKDNINEYLSKHAEYFFNKIKPKQKENFEKVYYRGLEAQRGWSLYELENRKGITCPFFTIEINDYEKIIKFANLTNINIDKLTRCLTQVAKDNNVSVSIVIDYLLTKIDYVKTLVDEKHQRCQEKIKLERGKIYAE